MANFIRRARAHVYVAIKVPADQYDRLCDLAHGQAYALRQMRLSVPQYMSIVERALVRSGPGAPPKADARPAAERESGAETLGW